MILEVWPASTRLYDLCFVLRDPKRPAALDDEGVEDGFGSCRDARFFALNYPWVSSMAERREKEGNGDVRRLGLL